MVTSRVTPKRAPISPGRDSRFSIRRNSDQGGAWWVHYEQSSGTHIPADDPHKDLVQLVNALKESEGTGPGGGFSINEHGQVIARMTPAGGYGGQNSIHVVGVSKGKVVAYSNLITFQGGVLNPSVTPVEGSAWTGPLCGISYVFSAPGNKKPPSHKLDEIRLEVDGANVLLSQSAGLDPYPPVSGKLADFLAALRRQLPEGGRFRVNEVGRAFTSRTNVFIGTVPFSHWFRPIGPTD